MPSKRNMSIKRKVQKKKTQKRNRKSRMSRKRGGCATCNRSSLLLGGNSAGLNYAINENPAVIPYNQASGTSVDPNDPSSMTDTRMQPNIITGGRRRRRRVLKGGSVDPAAANAISSFGTTTGLSTISNILMGNPTVDPSPLSQPLLQNPYANALV